MLRCCVAWVVDVGVWRGLGCGVEWVVDVEVLGGVGCGCWGVVWGGVGCGCWSVGWGSGVRLGRWVWSCQKKNVTMFTIFFKSTVPLPLPYNLP